MLSLIPRNTVLSRKSISTVVYRKITNEVSNQRSNNWSASCSILSTRGYAQSYTTIKSPYYQTENNVRSDFDPINFSTFRQRFAFSTNRCTMSPESPNQSISIEGGERIDENVTEQKPVSSNKTSLLSGLEDSPGSTVVWRESRNDYVFRIPQSSGIGYYEIPLTHVLRSTARDFSRSNRSPNGLVSHEAHDQFSRIRGLQNMQQQFASFSTEIQPKQNNEDTTNIQAPSHIISTPIPIRQRQIPSTTLGTTQIPTPASAPPVQTNPLESLKQTSPKGLISKGLDLTISAFRTIASFIMKIPGSTYYYLTHAKERQEAFENLRKTVKDEIHHYWVGTKLLWADIQTARSLLNKTLRGSSLSRRERRQLLRTVSDLFRLIPFSMFVIIPFMEFALPFALRLFPNLLPSTYQDSLKAEEDMKRELKTRIAMAQFFQETLEELAKEQKKKAAKKKQELEEAGIIEEESTIAKQSDSAGSMLEFLSKARRGEMIPPDVIIKYAKYFQDDLTLDNMPRMQLINMCRYMGIAPYGNDNFLRFQLRMKIRSLKEDDQRILWEGIDSLTKMELREACQERGMRSTGLSKEAYKRNLQQWLDLSVNKDVPISLLIMSRTFFLQEEAAEGDASSNLTGLADTISGLDKEIVNEVILEVATAQEKISDRDVRKIKLEVLSQQNELIKEEEEAREKAAAKFKEVTDKEKTEAQPKEQELAIAPQMEAPPSLSQQSEKVSVTSPPIVDKAAELEKEIISEKEKIPEKEPTLSTEEMDAISQLISQDPVSLERAELEKIKAAMKAEEKTKAIEEVAAADKPPSDSVPDIKPTESIAAMTPDEADKLVKETITKLDQSVAFEAEASTTITSTLPTPVLDESPQVSKAGTPVVEVEEEEDPVIARLKKRVESMVGKIEVQLTDAEMKIGDKLHFLDKDKDGVLSREEMAHALQTVLKRQLSFEEALEIADAMDENKDGIFTVAELSRWIDENKLVRFFEEGREHDMHRIIENVSNQAKKDDVSAASSSAQTVESAK